VREIVGIKIKYLLGLAASDVIVGAAIVAFRPNDVGYVEIKTVPIASVTHTALYFGSTKLTSIKNGDAILRQPVGKLRLQADNGLGSLAPLCDIVVMRNRVTTVTVSVRERPPRCQCRFSGRDAETVNSCVS